MSITQQHLLDAYRAHSLGEPVPPAPGTYDGVVRERRSRPARSGFRDVLGRWRRRPT
ncbi:hypothetical protein [Streptomyces paradoxus]|uniref:hypothetical protein n=1 Tax=Streptomyces paradoxus TaxID=66375 RepID=UPI0037D4C772